ncbi:MAG: diguanylate cyclase [Polyangiaceae bacterium]
MTISVGVAAARRGESSEAWLARADRALYEAKASGRNRALLG